MPQPRYQPYCNITRAHYSSECEEVCVFYMITAPESTSTAKWEPHRPNPPAPRCPRRLARPLQPLSTPAEPAFPRQYKSRPERSRYVYLFLLETVFEWTDLKFLVCSQSL